MSQTYSATELAGKGPQRTFTGDDLQQIAFPLGGIGAGCLHIGGTGNFQDFCLFNRPAFGHSPMTFAAVHCQAGKGDGVLRVLEGPVAVPHIFNQARFGNGGLASGHEGLPHMENAEFHGEYPFARVKLKDRALPLAVEIDAWSPLIPNDADASGMPSAFVTYRLRNRSNRRQRVQFSFSAQYPTPANLHGHDARDLAGHRVTHRREGGVAGLWFDSDLPADDLRKTSIAIVSPRSGQRADCAWFRGGWFDALTMLTNNLLAGTLKHAPESPPAMQIGRARFGATLHWTFDLAPGEKTEIPLVYAWHAPNTDIRHGGDACCGSYRPWYATQFDDAWAVGRRCVEEGESFRHRTERFHRALFNTSLPNYVLDAISANLAILKSPTVLRQEDGMMWCWEGSSVSGGCCAGSCTHVWNYAQAMPYLFPALERTLRDLELEHSMDRRGHVTFRSALPTGPVGHGFHAASDGQLGGVLKVYREWQVSGDLAWLKKRYPLVRRSLQYCRRTWDPEDEGALIEPHHNTYDIEFWGPDVMCTGFYLGALRAAAAMARALGKTDDADDFEALADRGRKYVDARLWNGEYFYQRVQWKNLRAGKALLKKLGSSGHRHDTGYSEEAAKILKKEGPKYQYGTGCISDGVMGQWMTTQLGLPDALNRSRTRRHLKAIFKHNFRQSLRGHANPQRPGYALNDEPGLLLCSWPKGGKPSLPFVYSDEVWTGIEYQVASHMCWEGLVDEGLSIVRAVRQRYDGKVRNPWNEYECGNYYARAMASYGLLLALTGFRYVAAEQRLELAPQLKATKGQLLFSVDSGWGTIAWQRRGNRVTLKISVEEGTLDLQQVRFGGPTVKGTLRTSMDESMTAKPGRATHIVVGA